MNLLKRIIKKLIRMVDAHYFTRRELQQNFEERRRSSKAPFLSWQALDPCYIRRLDAGGIQLKDKLYVFAGLKQDGGVVAKVDVFDLNREKWGDSIDLPSQMAHSHLGMISDGQRFIYAISGQWGGQCRPATNKCFVFDTAEKRWRNFPSLPKARYASTVQLWNGRLHALGGSAEDRNQPATDHWSIAVDQGNALEENWREEIPIPRGGPHRASAILQDCLYVFGGQEGDYVAIPGDENYTCTGDLSCESMYPDVYKLAKGANAWEKKTSMPIASSHTEFSIVVQNNTVILLGGQQDKHTQTKVITLTDCIQRYDATTDTWTLIGHLPYRSKSVVAGFYNNHLFFTTGQRDRGMNDPTPGSYDENMWKAPLR